LLLEKKRDLVVIMASTLTRRNAEISLKALALGAADYVPKPDSNRGITTSTAFRRELMEKIVELGARRRRRRGEAWSPVPAGYARAASRPAAPQAAAVLDHFPARAPDRRLDGRSAGAPGAPRAARRRLRADSGADRPAHAAD